MPRDLLSATAPYPWGAVAPLRDLARRHAGGAVDLSIGSPVDPVPAFIVEALTRAGDSHAYTTASGTPELRDAVVAWYGRRRGVSLTPDEVLPTIGSKEFIAQLALWMGLGPGDTVVQPTLHYPTYAVGAEASGAEVIESDDPSEWPETTRLVWINSPSNPDGRVADVPALRAAVARARELGALIVSDECYAELGWGTWDGTPTPCILHNDVTGGSHDGVLALYSLSKQSNMAGYRAALACGDARAIGGLVNLRKQFGLAMPAPIQAAMTAALSDDAHVDDQRNRYRARREALLPAARAWGLWIEHSEAGLYLWGTRDEDGWDTMRALASLGIVAGPGAFYGAGGRSFIRLSLTASDTDIGTAAERLRQG